jgi:hypothetical protein
MTISFTESHLKLMGISFMIVKEGFKHNDYHTGEVM